MGRGEGGGTGKGGREHQPLGEEGGLKKLNGRKKTKHEKEEREDAGGRRRDVKSYPAEEGSGVGGGQQLCQFMAIMSKECSSFSLAFFQVRPEEGGGDRGKQASKQGHICTHILEGKEEERRYLNTAIVR